MAKRESAPKKTETLTLRLDPKTKFAIELLAREQKRTLAGVIEWSVEKALAGQEVVTGSEKGNLRQLVDKVWSPDELERTIGLGIHAEHSLSFEEQCFWLVIRDNPHFLEVYDRDAAGRIFTFCLRKDRISHCRTLIEQRASDLRHTGKFTPISLEEIKEVGGPALELYESANFEISKEKLMRGLEAK